MRNRVKVQVACSRSRYLSIVLSLLPLYAIKISGGAALWESDESSLGVSAADPREVQIIQLLGPD